MRLPIEAMTNGSLRIAAPLPGYDDGVTLRRVNTGGLKYAEFQFTDSDDPRQGDYYYVRVLENPTCRWSTWDAIRAGPAPRPDLPCTIQERGWSSPIWVIP